MKLDLTPLVQARDGASRKELLAIAGCAMAGRDRLVGNTPEADVG